MDLHQVIENVNNLHGNIANDVWPEGWHGECHICGKEFFYTREECGYYLAHGWPECDHKPAALEVKE
jgi:hypothetical protein